VVIGTTVIRIGTPVIEGVDVGTTVNLFRAPVPYAQGREISTAVLRGWAGRLVGLGRRISKSTGFLATSDLAMLDFLPLAESRYEPTCIGRHAPTRTGPIALTASEKPVLYGLSNQFRDFVFGVEQHECDFSYNCGCDLISAANFAGPCSAQRIKGRTK
jgi:hypothetical protein